MRKLLPAGLVVAIALGAAGTAVADKSSPIFGNASVQTTTPAENKSVVGKGVYGALYGYYGNYYAAYAVQYGSLGSYYGYSSSTGGSSYYYSAYQYASYATTYYSDAYYYQSRGM